VRTHAQFFGSLPYYTTGIFRTGNQFQLEYALKKRKVPVSITVLNPAPGGGIGNAARLRGLLAWVR
jgi:hypothetical protein